MVELDALDMRAARLQPCRRAFVRTIDLDVVRELSLAFHAMPEGLAGRVIAIAVALQEPVAVLRQCHCVLARAWHSHGLNQALFPQAPQIAGSRIERVIMVITEITTGDHSKRADGRQRPRLGPAERVLAVAIADEFALRAAGEIQVPREWLARVRRTVPRVVLAIRPARNVTGIVSSVDRIRLAGTSRTLTK